MKRTNGLITIIFLLFPFLINAQGEAALPALGLNPNPQSFGMGMLGVSLATNDPLGFYFNPAMLGYASRTNNLAIQFYTDKVSWLPGIIPNTTFNNTGITAGYNFGKIGKGVNLSAGVGFITSSLDYGWFYTYDPRERVNVYSDSFDKYNAFGGGISLDYYINLSLGLTYKRIDSKLSAVAGGEAKINALDWGLLLNIPISKLTAGKYEYKPFENTGLKPLVNLSLGYSRSNIGSEVTYFDPAQKDPLPLTGRLGYTISLGADLLLHNQPINFFTFDISIEAEDLLVSVDNSGNITYQGLLGDIKTVENLFEWKRTDKVTLRKGQKISFFETFSLLKGSFYSSSPNHNTTDGIIISSNGIFKLLSWNFNDNKFVKFFLDHFEIEYVRTMWNPNFNDVNLYPANLFPYATNVGKSEMEAISISIKGFTF